MFGQSGRERLGLTVYSAVLGSYFLNEKLGTLGKLGCAICLIGSVVIVLHAPPDKDIQTIDEILNYAIKPGKTPQRQHHWIILTSNRLSFLRTVCDCLCNSHDIPHSTKVRQEESTDLSQHLQHSRQHFDLRSQGTWNRSQAHTQRQQPVDSPKHIRVSHCHNRGHHDANELL